MKQDLTDFINSQDEELQPTLHEYYDNYLVVTKHGDEQASKDVLAFLKRIISNPGSDIPLELENSIEKIKNDGYRGHNVGVGGKRKKSKKSKKSRKSRKSRRKRTSRRN